MTAIVAATLVAVVSVAEAGADAAVLAILSPRDTIPVSAENTPRARVALYAGSGTTLWVKVMIEDICDPTPFYWDSVQVLLGTGDSTEVSFSPWVPTYPVLHRVTCWTALTGDTYPSNDTLRQFFWVGRGSNVQEQPAAAEGRLSVTPTLARGCLRLPEGERAELLDAAGRRLMELNPGANDVHSLPPGVYLVRPESGRAATKVVVR
jgi:hypothetical protein